MALTSDFQKLEPGNRIQLIDIDGSAFGADMVRFHGHNIAFTPAEIDAAGGDETLLAAKSIWWQGNEYRAWPCQIEGVDASTDGQAASPKLSVGNLNGSVTALCLAYDDMLQAKVTVRNTLAHYLDARNFDDGNQQADPSQEVLQVFYIDSKSAETNVSVEFTLSSPIDLQGLQLPDRQLHSVCTWCMRGLYRTGNGCSWNGTTYYDRFNNPVDDPSQDVCAGNVPACKVRFGENNPLDFGGFVGTTLLKN